MERDPALYHEASETPDMAEIDSPVEILAEKIQERMEWSKLKSKAQFCMSAAIIAIESAPGQESTKSKEALVRIVAMILDQPQDRSRMVAACIDFAAGMGIAQGKTQTQIAEENGVKKATVSRICNQISDLLVQMGIPRSRGMKSQESRAVYAEKRRGKRKQPVKPWGFGATLKGIVG